MMDLEQARAALHAGDFSVKPWLREFLLTTCDTTNAPAPRLWAAVATHADVSAFAEAIDIVTRPEAVRRVVVSLGLTLSPAAIPLLWKIHDDFDDSELDEYVAMALETIAGDQERGLDLADPGARSALEAGGATLDPHQYHYHGVPVFPGDITKDLIVAATVARHEEKKIALLYGGELLGTFFGIDPPVQPGQPVDDLALEAVFAYVQSVASFSWKRGWKYFHRHAIVGAS